MKTIEDFLNPKIKGVFDDETQTLPSFAWPGGYPMFYVDGDNSVLCPKCANRQVTEAVEEIGEHGEPLVPRFLPADYEANYEDDSLYCDECSTRIESAYAEG